MRLRLFEQIYWTYWGDVAEQVHRSDGAFEAIAGLIVFGVIEAGTLYLAVDLVSASGLPSILLGGLAFAVALLMALYWLILAGAVYVFATQETELPDNFRGVD